MSESRHGETAAPAGAPSPPDPEVGDPDALEARRTSLFASLGLPRSFFRGRAVVQFGGSPEAALQYALWGGAVTVVAADPKHGERTERLFLRHRQTLRIEPREKLLGEGGSLARFAFVACEEPLLVSEDPLREVEAILGRLPRDGVLLAALPEAHCWRRRSLMQRVVQITARGPDELRRAAREWFAAHVADTAAERGVPRDVALEDLFVHRRGRPVDFAAICRAFAHHGMTLLGSDPPLRAPRAAPGDDLFDYSRFHAHYRALERSWIAFGRDAAPSRGCDPSGVHAAIDAECAALEAIADRIAQRDVDDALIARVQRSGADPARASACIDRLVVLAAKQ